MEERRLLLAVALTLLVLTGYQMLFPPAPPPHRPAAVAGQPTATPSEAQPSPATSPVASTAAPVVKARVADDREKRVEVEAPEASLVFTNRGGRLVSWTLRKFTDLRGRPEEMVQAARGGPRPLDLETGEAAVDEMLKQALFRPSTENLSVPAKGDAELSFHYADGEIEAVKHLQFRAPGYLIAVSAEVRRLGQELPVKAVWGPGVGNPTESEKAVQGYEPPTAVFLGPGGVERVPTEKIGASRSLPDVHWAGVESTYFVALWVPPSHQAEVRAVSLPAAPNQVPITGPVAVVALGREAALLYVGPKDHSLLSKMGYRLQEVVPVGDWLGPIVIPLMALLRWVHGHVGNYGWSIIALTVLINLVMAPLRHYSIANGVKMAKLAPEMKVIQERYRKYPALDPKRQEMQQEMAALYARHGMSMGTQMLVGCLPQLITLPFLFAFYTVLKVAIELRGADFLWISDLSQRDPLFITPVLMGLSMAVMQKMLPTAMDPAQQRIMMIMPLVLAVMFFAAPAGLNLYWLASNVCSIIQQGVTLRVIRSKEDPEARKERRR